MKAVITILVWLNPATLPKEHRHLIKFQKEKGRQFPSPCFKPGTEIDGALALQLVKCGQASPLDDECRKAVGLDADALTRSQREYAAAAAGIKGPRDLAMFMAGAIEGYLPGTTDEKPLYIKGPNWDAWMEAEAEEAAEATGDDLDAQTSTDTVANDL